MSLMTIVLATDASIPPEFGARMNGWPSDVPLPRVGEIVADRYGNEALVSDITHFPWGRGDHRPSVKILLTSLA